MRELKPVINLKRSAGTILAVTIFSAWWTLSKSKKRLKKDSKASIMKRVQLMEGETSTIMMDVATSISTVTFMEGNHKSAGVYIRQRLKEMIKMNPWLCGYLDQDTKLGEKSPVFVFHDTMQSVDEAKKSNDVNNLVDFVFTHLKPGFNELNRNTSYPDMSKIVKPFLVKKGSESIRRPQEPQFKVTIIPDVESENNRWALIVSMSHVIADGHTFYKIHNMLSEDTPIIKLNFTRKPLIMSYNAVKAMGKENVGFLQQPKPGLLIHLAASTILGKLFGPTCAVRIFKLNNDFIASKKKESLNGNDGIQFVSTNDIITSTICSVSKCDIGTMDVNFRGRLQSINQSNMEANLEDTDAGNYEDKIIYRTPDCSTPSLIRKSITNDQNNQNTKSWLIRASTPHTILPKSILDFWKIQMITCVSNWSTFSKPLHLEKACNSIAILHLPLFESNDIPARTFTGCFIFSARENETEDMKKGMNTQTIGLAVAGRPDVLDAISKCGLVNGSL